MPKPVDNQFLGIAGGTTPRGQATMTAHTDRELISHRETAPVQMQDDSVIDRQLALGLNQLEQATADSLEVGSALSSRK